LYDYLFTKPNAEEVDDGQDFTANVNPNSLETLTACLVEPSLKGATPGSRYQLERQGYFCVDAKDSTAGRLVFNRTATLRDTWAKIERTEKS
jgi:glutaminyl-tRNA synthetase